MATGDLSPAQADFRDRLVAETGLDKHVVTAWIGAESGWGVTKAGHNYLNVGPGRRYADEDEAAAATARLINTSPHYERVRAHPGAPAAQIAAIIASPWDAGHYTPDGGTVGEKLMRVYDQLTGADSSKTSFLDNLTIDLNPFDSVVPKPNLTREAIAERAGGIGGALQQGALELGLTLLLVLAGLALIVIGLYAFARPGLIAAGQTAADILT